MRVTITMMAAFVAMAVGVPANAIAQLDFGSFLDTTFQAPTLDRPYFERRFLAKAKPDECFDGIGNPYPEINPDGTCDSGTPKTNEAYVFGLTQSGRKLWLGTAPNPLCLASGGYLGNTDPIQTSDFVCEFGQGYYQNIDPLPFPLPPALGDWRPARAYEYDTSTGKLTDRTPDPSSVEGLLFVNMLGIRSAGSLGNVVMLAGPSLLGGASFFAYASDTGELVGACNVGDFTNIRQWLMMNDELYAGVATPSGGGIIRWTGSEEVPFSGQKCSFEKVGEFDGDAAYIASYGADRIVVSAWPIPNKGGAGVYVSPSFGDNNRLDLSDGMWERVWQPSDYEPDPIVAGTYVGGAIIEWKGEVYWGIMHAPGAALLAHANCPDPTPQALCYGVPENEAEALDVFLGTNRSTPIFRGRDLAGDVQIELLYGESELPKLIPGTKTFTPISTGWTPLFGSSGFGNIFANYAWSAAIADDRLVFGMMDWRYLFDELLGSLLSGIPFLGEVLPDVIGGYGYVKGHGADLWRFDTRDRPATPENTRGLGNPLNYGVRTLITGNDGKSLYAGTANAINLSKKGGWELHRLRAPLWPRLGYPWSWWR